MDMNWPTQRAEHGRIDAFELWCWRRLLRVPWTKRRSSQSILKEISPKYSLEELMMKLKPPDVKSQLPWKDPEAGKYWGHEKGEIVDEMVGWHYRLNGHEFEQTLGDSKGQGSLVCCSPWDHKELDMTKRLNNNINGITADTNFFTYLVITFYHIWCYTLLCVSNPLYYVSYTFLELDNILSKYLKSTQYLMCVFVSLCVKYLR